MSVSVQCRILSMSHAHEYERTVHASHSCASVCSYCLTSAHILSCRRISQSHLYRCLSVLAVVFHVYALAMSWIENELIAQLVREKMYDSCSSSVIVLTGQLSIHGHRSAHSAQCEMNVVATGESGPCSNFVAIHRIDKSVVPVKSAVSG